MNESFQFWISKLNDADEEEDEVQASIDMLRFIMGEEAVPHLIRTMMDGTRSREIRESAAEALSEIAGERGRSDIRQLLVEPKTSEQELLIEIALSEPPIY